MFFCHPRKTEVRFADPEGVREQVKAAVENALLGEGLVRTSAPRGRSAPDQTEVAPERDDPDAERGAGTDRDSTGTDDAPPESGRSGDPTAGDEREAGDGTASAAATPPTDEGDPIGPDDIRETGPTGTRRSDSGAAASGADAADAADAEANATGPEASAGGVTADTDGAADPHTRRFRSGTEQARLGSKSGEEPAGERDSFERLPAMRVLGQLDDTYVVAETADGLVLIDQHAADERINYERLRERFAGETTAQALAEPVELSLTAREAALFAEYEDALARLGFRAERTDDRTVAVRTVPELVAEAAGPDLVREVLSAFVTGEAAAAETVDAAADDLLADLACYPSITGNTSLTEGTVVDLLARLDDCENPWACPHGRPVVTEFDREEIEARFERDYPGHGG